MSPAPALHLPARGLSLLAAALALTLFSTAGTGQETGGFSRQDQLRGSITPERAWWDVRHYALDLEVFPDKKRLVGSNRIRFRPTAEATRMQIDLQPPLEVTEVTWNGAPVATEREGNVVWIDFPQPPEVGEDHEVVVHYAGTPIESVNPPWNGGVSWNRDEKGNPFIATACQGIGASVWWPNKDHGADEPDEGMDIRVTVPEDLVAVSNGRLLEVSGEPDRQTKTFLWRVTNPINNYGVNLNIGKYVNFSEVFQGEGGPLDMDYWCLVHQREKAIEQFKEAPRTIEAFEYWFGKYPFYEDSYKLVVVPYLGMEHQSSVTYGNGFRNGYRGTDLSGTGVGLKFDFIIVHESGHEWFGNNISMKDAADMWIHESFTNYSENLFVEYHFSREEAEDYVIGCRKRIRNDRPIIGTYGVNRSGSGDMYYKGGNLLHTLRHMLDDDERWRAILRGLNETFWHQTVTTEQIEDYLSRETGMALGPFFDQYLRTTQIPRLRVRVDGTLVHYRFENVVDGFRIPIEARINGRDYRLVASAAPRTFETLRPVTSFSVDRNFYIESTVEGLDDQGQERE